MKYIVLWLFMLSVCNVNAQLWDRVSRTYLFHFDYNHNSQDSSLRIFANFQDSFALSKAINKDFDSIVITDILSTHTGQFYVWADENTFYPGGIFRPYKIKNKKVTLRSFNPASVSFRIQFYYSFYRTGLGEQSITDLDVFNYESRLVLNNTGVPRKFKIELYNTLGQLIIQQNEIVSGKQEVYLGDFKGIYTAIIKEDDKIITQKILLD